MQQSINTVNNAEVHIKVKIEGEFRRFSIQEVSFESLEETLRTMCRLSPTTVLNIKFLDDDEDLVTITSNEELTYAIELTGTLRLEVVVENQAVEEEETVKDKDLPPFSYWEKRARRGGRGGGRGCGRGKRGGCTEKLSFEKRRELRASRVEAKIFKLTSLLESGTLPVGRTRAIAWKLQKIEKKREYFAAIERGDIPCRGGRGGRRGMRGKCGMPHGPDNSHETVHINSLDTSTIDSEKLMHLIQRQRDLKSLREAGAEKAACKSCRLEIKQARMAAFPQVFACRAALKAAKDSGDAEQVESCFLALKQAQKQMHAGCRAGCKLVDN